MEPTAIQEDLYKAKTLWRNSGILDRWHAKEFAQFTNDPLAKKQVLSYAEKVEEMWKEGIGLYLHGLNGVGKTMLVMCLLKEIALKHSVRAITLGTLINLYTAGWYDKQSARDFQEIVSTPHFLEVEEIGKEYKSGNNDLGLTVLDTVVRYRLQAMKPILFTTNLGPKQIASTYSHDIASMLQECTLIVEVKGTDKRTDIHNELRRKYHV